MEVVKTLVRPRDRDFLYVSPYNFSFRKLGKRSLIAEVVEANTYEAGWRNSTNPGSIALLTAAVAAVFPLRMRLVRSGYFVIPVYRRPDDPILSLVASISGRMPKR